MYSVFNYRFYYVYLMPKKENIWKKKTKNISLKRNTENTHGKWRRTIKSAKIRNKETLPFHNQGCHSQIDIAKHTPIVPIVRTFLFFIFTVHFRFLSIWVLYLLRRCNEIFCSFETTLCSFRHHFVYCK